MNQFLPEESNSIFAIFCELDTAINEILFENFGTPIYSLIFMYFRMTFLRLINCYTESSENRTLTEENKIFQIKNSISVVCKFLMRERRVRVNSADSKVQEILLENDSNNSMFIGHILKALLTLNYGERTKDLLNEMLYFLVGFSENQVLIYKRILDFLNEHILQGIPNQGVQDRFELVVQQTCFKYYTVLSCAEFKRKFGAFMEDFIVEFISKEAKRFLQ